MDDLAYCGVALLGGLLGLCELLARYRDEPAKAVLNPAAAFYVFTNVFAALVALGLLFAFKVDFGIASTEPVRLAVTRVLVGGLGAMAFFRSSLFTFKLGDKDIPLGPGLVLQVLLDVTDRQVDRSRAGPRAVAVTQIMAGVDFDKAKVALPAYCFGLMQNVGPDEQAAVGEQVTRLNTETIPPPVRSLLLGLMVLNLVGEQVLKAAIVSLGDEIRTPPGIAQQ